MKKHRHEFESDGGNCIHCGKTIVELLEEGEKSGIAKDFDPKKFLKKLKKKYVKTRSKL